MILPVPPFAFFMGGETQSDWFAMAGVIFGGGATDDGNWPGGGGSAEANDPDTDGDSTETVPATHRFMADSDRPTSFADYPVRQCAASGHWGAAHAMVCVEGRWYLRRFAIYGKSGLHSFLG